MNIYTWTLARHCGSSSATGDQQALTGFLRDARLPGVMPADWVVDLLLADGFQQGEAVFGHEGSEGWTLTVKPIVTC